MTSLGQKFRSVSLELTVASLCLLLCSTVPAAVSSSDVQQQWVLQLGYFASLENALNYKQSLAEAGFDLQTVATGLPAEQRYRVISRNVNDPDDLMKMREAIERITGNPGIIKQSPFETKSAANVFDQPELKYLLAQATPMPVSGSSVSRASGYESMLNRSPQEEIESTPGFTFGGLQITPTVGLSIGYNDNITRSNVGEISSMFYMVSPSIRVELPTDHSVLALTAALDMVRYDDSPIDDRDSWYLRGQWAWDISTRQNLNLFAQYSDGTDPRGEGRRQGDFGLVEIEPDKWDLWNYGGEWDYGAVGARGRLTLKAGVSDLSYTNNNAGTGLTSIDTRALERDWHYFGGTFFWRVAPKTSLLLDYLRTDINYKLATEPDSDSTEESWMIGATWEASARTSGTIKYGNLNKDFDDPAKPGYDGPTWVASVSWRPRTYSLFTLTGTRNTQEPDGGGDYVLSQELTLSWLHDWATRFGTTVDIGVGQDEYRPTDRKDDYFYWGVAARYTFNQHFRLGASVTSYDRNSGIGQFDYNQMVYMLTLEATF